ncbi:MAG: hypothetical protein AB7O97_10170 [Planctomycetota bacterium]
MLLKACGIYPPEHPRVVQSASACAVELERWIDPPNWLAMRVRGDHIVIGRVELESRGPLVHWMIGRLRDAGLAGLEFGPRVDTAAAVEFARTLSACTGRNGRTFSAAWPENHAKIRPLDLVFTGLHDADADGVGAGPASGTAGTAAQDVWKLDLVARLSRSTQLRDRLRAIETACEQMDGAAGHSSTSIDLVSGIVDLLPVEVAQDFDHVDEVVGRVLEHMQLAIARVLREGGEVNDAELLRIGLSVAKKYFGKSAGEVALPKELPTGRPEDERILADVDLLFAELEDLPSAVGLSAPRAEDCVSTAPGLAAELCGIYLHVLLGSERKETRAALASCLPGTLQTLGPASWPILDSYLLEQRSSFEQPTSDADKLRVLAFLERTGRCDVIQERGYARPELMAATFPASLPVFARILGANAQGIEVLRRVLAGIGAGRMRAAADELFATGQLLDPGVVTVIAAVGGAVVLPLLRRVVTVDQSAIRTTVVGYLRTLPLPAAESAALRCVEPAPDLPARYLEELFRLASDKVEQDPRTRQLSSQLLRAFAADPRRRHERRLVAIAGLRHLPGVETRALLRRLAGEGRFTQFSATARALRRQARSVLQRLGERGDA